MSDPGATVLTLQRVPPVLRARSRNASMGVVVHDKDSRISSLLALTIAVAPSVGCVAGHTAAKVGANAPN
jgi:predicted N-formylglutamate amidohydrolase